MIIQFIRLAESKRKELETFDSIYELGLFVEGEGDDTKCEFRFQPEDNTVILTSTCVIIESTTYAAKVEISQYDFERMVII